LETSSDSDLGALVKDIIDLQSAFLQANNCDPRDDISEMVLKLRGSIPKLTADQVRVLVTLHSYTFKNDSKLKSLHKGVILTRKCISSADVTVFLSEQWGNPSLGGFFARKIATAGLGANEIILQLGLDYDGSPYVSSTGPCGLVYLIEADVDIEDNGLIPLDPRLIEKIKALSHAEGEDAAKYLLSHSYACAVADGSAEAKAAAISLAPPYVGAGFCVHGTKLDGGHEVKLVQELVAMKRANESVTAQRISYSPGAGLWAQGKVGEEWLVASWNGKDWIPNFKAATDIPNWLASLEGQTQSDLFAKWERATQAGHGN